MGKVKTVIDAVSNDSKEFRGRFTHSDESEKIIDHTQLLAEFEIDYLG